MNDFIIRAYRAEDLPRITELFKDTVSSVCSADYSTRQTDAWLSGAKYTEWGARFANSFTLVAEIGGKTMAFGNIARGGECGGVQLRAEDGYLDMLYVDKSCLRRGIATALCNELEGRVRGRVFADVSLTAQPFFLSRGYVVIKPQKVVRRGVELNNFAMVKNVH